MANRSSDSPSNLFWARATLDGSMVATRGLRNQTDRSQEAGRQRLHSRRRGLERRGRNGLFCQGRKGEAWMEQKEGTGLAC